MTLPKKSAAAVLIDYNRPLEVQEIEVPEPEPNAVIVQVEASTMCGTDVHIYQGEYASLNFSKLPLVMGHEIVGRVVALGRERKTDSTGKPLQEGDLVAWSYAWCGQCYWCTVARQPTLCANSRMYGWGPVDQFPHLTGGFAEYAYIMPPCKIVKVPENLDPAVAASATCAFRTIVHGYEKIGRIETIDTVVIQGSGPVGLYALAFAVQSGAKQTICIGAPAERLELARKWGADYVLSIEDTDIPERRERILGLTEGRGADLVVECSGAGIAFVEGMDLVRRGGRYLVIGAADPNPVEIKSTYFNMRQLTVAGTLSGDLPHYYRALQFLSDHQDKFPFHELLGNRYSLSGVNDALDSMKNMREAKPVILPQKQS